MTLVIGVDVGGTSAEGVVLDENGEEVARGTSSGAIVTLQDPDSAAAAVTNTVRSAAVDGEIRLPVSVLWAGLAGAGSQAARRIIEDKLSGTGLADTVQVGTDVEAAFFDAFGSGPGVLLIAGTGLRARSQVSPFSVLDLNHITISVSNLQRSLDFYQQLFDLTVYTSQNAGSLPIMTIGSGPQFIAVSQTRRARTREAGIGHHFCDELILFDSSRECINEKFIRRNCSFSRASLYYNLSC